MIADQNPTHSQPIPFQRKQLNGKAKYSNMFAEAKELQSIVMQQVRDKDIKPFLVAQLARAYKELAELRLRLQHKGPPKAVDYGAAKAKRKAPAKGFSETAEVKTVNVKDKPI